MLERLKRLAVKENKITREETVGGVRFIYHQDLDECFRGISPGWIDMNRVIHLTEPERLVAFIRNHELIHYRRWNKPTMRCLRFFKSVMGRGAIVALFVFALVLLEVLGTNIPILIAMGLTVVPYIICEAYEEHIASRGARKICEELRRWSKHG